MRAATYFSARPCSKGFLAFLASSACAASATSYHSCSAAPLPWPSGFLGLRTSSSLGAPFWPSGLTLRSSGPAFCGPLTLAVSRSKPALFRPCNIQRHLASQAVIRWVFCRVPGFAFGRCAGFNFFCRHRFASVAQCFFAVCVRRQAGASRFGFWV